MKIGNLSLLQLIGKVTMGEVYLSSKTDSKEFYATKKIKKEYADRPQVKKYFYNEITILKKLKHNKIVRLIELKQTPSHYYIVMEYCNGGSLLNCLKKYMNLYKKPFSEEIVQFLMRQIVSGVKYIHKHKIIHRDLKLDNILVKFYSKEDLKSLDMMKTHVKISDFGISITLGEKNLAYTALGSPAYMDPFILKKLNERNDLAGSEGYDQSADIWSLGAMCYEMLMGKRAFTGRNIKDLTKNVEEGNYSLPTHMSKEVVSFINGMLQYDSKKRLNIEELSRHVFLTKKPSDFNTIDFVLVCNKLGKSGININTKNNSTMWNIFNEETEVKLNSIPSKILDKNSYPESQPSENEKENKNETPTKNEIETQAQTQNEKIEEVKVNQQYPSYNDDLNKIKYYNQNIPQSKYNNNEKSMNITNMNKVEKTIPNNNYNIFKNNSNIQFEPPMKSDFNTFQNNTIDFNMNNMGNIGSYPYNTDSTTTNIQNQNYQFYGGQTINPQNNYNFNNYNQTMDPNYPGDITVKKEIATTNESCMNQ